MALAYRTPSEIGDAYLLHVKGLKPEVDIAQTDSDWWIRSRVVGGVVAGVYADQIKIANDAFPQSARHDALYNHLILYFSNGFTPATQSIGSLLVGGATGSTINFGQQFVYGPNGNTYTATQTVAFGPAATAVVPIQSVNTGQNQNLLSGATLTVSSTPAGISPAATAFGNISDGRNDETDPEAAARILTQVRTPLAGGKVADYQTFALAADPAVTSASVLRYPFGFGTVGVIITSGTTDVDEALNNGIPVIRTPSDALVAKVEAYIETQNPVTDCATVLKPATTPIDVTVTVRFSSGNSATIIADPVNTVTPGGATMRQDDFVRREIQRAIYKTPVGGRLLGASGYVVNSEMEDLIDENLGNEAYSTGAIVQIISDRQVSNLSATGANRAILPNEMPLPGVITVVEASP